MKKWFSSVYKFLLFSVSFSFLLSLFFISSASALTGDADISSAWNDYVWIYTDSGPIRWDSNTFGQIIYNGMESINGIAFNVSLDWYGDYGSYTSGTVEFTLEANGGWAIDGGNLSNILCEVWTASGQNQRQIPSTMGIKNSYYLSSVQPRKHAVDYQCNFEATNNLKPAYVYIRVGNNSNNNATIIPIIGGYNLNGGFIPSPRIRNVSYHYTTSNESLDSGNIQQIERNTSDLINGQKEIYDELQNQTTTLNNSIQETTSAVENLTQATQDAEDGEQSRWEADKAEMAEREENGSDDVNQLLSIFNFNFSNPFAPILDSFTNQQCVNIPTIANWLHSSSSQYCSWWPESIRNVLTPVFGLASSILLFGFVISWLRGGSSSQIPTGEKGIVYKTK